MDGSFRFRERKKTSLNLPSRERQRSSVFKNTSSIGSSSSFTDSWRTRPSTRLPLASNRPKTTLSVEPIRRNHDNIHSSSLLLSGSSLYPSVSNQNLIGSRVNSRSHIHDPLTVTTSSTVLPGSIPNFFGTDFTSNSNRSSSPLLPASRQRENIRERLLNRADRPKTTISIPSKGHTPTISTNGDFSRNFNRVSTSPNRFQLSGAHSENRQGSFVDKYLNPTLARSDLFSSQQPKPQPAKYDSRQEGTHYHRFPQLKQIGSFENGVKNTDINKKREVVAGEEFMPSDNEDHFQRKRSGNQGPGLFSTVLSKLSNFFNQPNSDFVGGYENSNANWAFAANGAQRENSSAGQDSKVTKESKTNTAPETSLPENMPSDQALDSNNTESDDERKKRTEKLNKLMKEHKSKTKKVKKLKSKKDKSRKQRSKKDRKNEVENKELGETKKAVDQKNLLLNERPKFLKSKQSRNNIAKSFERTSTSELQVPLPKKLKRKAPEDDDHLFPKSKKRLLPSGFETESIFLNNKLSGTSSTQSDNDKNLRAKKFFLGNDIAQKNVLRAHTSFSNSFKDNASVTSQESGLSDRQLHSKVLELEGKNKEIARLNNKVSLLESSLLDIRKSLTEIKANQSNQINTTENFKHSHGTQHLSNNENVGLISSTPAMGALTDKSEILKDLSETTFDSHILARKYKSAIHTLNPAKEQAEKDPNYQTPQVIIEDFKKISQQINEREKSICLLEKEGSKLESERLNLLSSVSSLKKKNADKPQETQADQKQQLAKAAVQQNDYSDDEFDTTNIDETLAKIEQSVNGLSPVRVSFQE